MKAWPFLLGVILLFGCTANQPSAACALDNSKPSLSISYEIRGPDYLHITLDGKDSDNDTLVYSLGVTDTSGNPVGNLTLNPDKTYTWTDNTEFVRYVNAVASVSDVRGGQVCSTVTENQTILAAANITSSG